MANERLKDRRGDEEKRECAQYGLCDNLTTKWRDEEGEQLYCPVCNSSIYVDYTEEELCTR